MERDRDRSDLVAPGTLELGVALHACGLTGVAVDRHYARLDSGKFATDLDDLVASVERGIRQIVSRARGE